MERKSIDLHVHSTASDGTFSPSELIDEAIKKNLSAMALTDHDSMAGVKEALQKASSLTSLRLIPGVELSSLYKGKEIHVVGLFLNPDDIDLQEQLLAFQQKRDLRNVKMVENLQNEGFDIDLEHLYHSFPDTVVTRAHIARYLFQTGQIKSVQVAFEKYIGNDCRCYVKREMITPMEACDLIQKHGGISVLAHPILYRMNLDRLKEMIDEMKDHGLTGIEAIYSTYQPGEERLIRSIAAEKNLLLSGGSDFHGANKPYIQLGTGMGSLFVPYEFLTDLEAARRAQ